MPLKTKNKLLMLGVILIIILASQNVFASTDTTFTYSAGSSRISTGDYAYAGEKFTVNKNFYLTSIQMYGRAYFRAAIYDSAGNRLSTGSGVNVGSTSRWNTSVLTTPVYLEAGKTYYLLGETRLTESRNGYIYYNTPVSYPITVSSSPSSSVVTLISSFCEDSYSEIYDTINPASLTANTSRCFQFILTGKAAPNTPEISFPTNGQYFNSIPSFIAIVSDPGSDTVNLEVQYSTSSSFSAYNTLISSYVVSGSSVTLKPSSALNSGQWYFRVRSTNSLGLKSNWSSNYGFYIDKTAPTGSIGINSGATYTVNTGVALQITGSDTRSGISQMKFSNDGSTWGSWVPYSTSYSYALPSTNGTRTVYMQLKDRAGNVSSIYSDSIILDTVAPIGTVTINSGNAYSNNKAVSLAITYSDATSGTSQMQVSTQSDFSGVPWVAVTPIYNYTLTSGDGTKTVYIRFKDNAGNVSGTFSDTIILDTVVPSGSITVKSIDGLSKTADTTVVLTISGRDDQSGLAGMRLSNNGTSWTNLEPLTSPKNWEVSVGAGTKTVYLKLVDKAGNDYITSGDIYLVDDVIGPSVELKVNGGVEAVTSRYVDLTIRAFDNFSKTSELKMRFSNNGTLWSAWESYSENKSNWDIANFSYGGTTTQGNKIIYVQVLDSAQNIGLGRADIGYSTSIPTGSLAVSSGVAGTYNGQAVMFVKNPKVNLTLSFVNAKQMRISLDGVSFSPWEPYSSSLEITLPKGDGLNNIALQVKDNNGAESDVKTYGIVMDTVAPNIAVTTTNGATATTTGSVQLTIIASDNISTEGFYYRINDGAWIALPSNGQITVSNLSKGLRNIKVDVKDQAGNIGTRSIRIWSL